MKDVRPSRLRRATRSGSGSSCAAASSVSRTGVLLRAHSDRRSARSKRAGPAAPEDGDPRSDRRPGPDRAVHRPHNEAGRLGPRNGPRRLLGAEQPGRDGQAHRQPARGRQLPRPLRVARGPHERGSELHVAAGEATGVDALTPPTIDTESTRATISTARTRMALPLNQPSLGRRLYGARSRAFCPLDREACFTTRSLPWGIGPFMGYRSLGGQSDHRLRTIMTEARPYR
jgi:hypothetical protein